jgi:hypothetical protein
VGFDLFIHCLQIRKPWGLPEEELRSLFPVVDAASKSDYWSIAYDNLNRCSLALSPLAGSGSSIRDIHVERPCGDLRLWKALLRILQMGPVVLYFPGGPPVVGTAEASVALPKSDLASLGEARRVESAEELLSVIRHSRGAKFFLLTLVVITINLLA